jgi:hypothetical protein
VPVRGNSHAQGQQRAHNQACRKQQGKRNQQSRRFGGTEKEIKGNVHVGASYEKKACKADSCAGDPWGFMTEWNSPRGQATHTAE